MSVKLTRDCDTILPYGLKTTPFETVFKALQDVAGTVWDVDPTVYRAAIAWAYYLTHNRTPLVNLHDALTILPAIAVSEAVPLVKDYMDAAQLVELLAQWHDYRPSQAALERLYTAYGMTVDVRPITDDEGQAILPHPIERGAFYVIARAIEWGRGLTPEEISIVADRAAPLGGKPVVVYALADNRLDVATHARTAGASQVVWSDEPAEEYVPPAPPAQLVPIYIQSGNLRYQSSVKNDTSKSDTYCYAIYSDEERTTPYVFDWGKRNVFGYLSDGEFVATSIQTQAELPSTTGANTGYLLCVNKRSSPSTDGCLWLAWNSYQDGYNRYTTRYLMIYDDAISFWFKSDHSDDSNPAFVNWNTGIDYDSSKTYKVLALVNSDGIKVNDEILYATTFAEQSGKLIIQLTAFLSSSKPMARVVFYAEDKTVYTGYFNAGNGNAQKSVENAWASTGDQYEGVYQLNSDTAYQFNASATYTILSVFYTDGTTVTNETLAPYSISGSLTMINNPWVPGVLTVRTKSNNKITGYPCGCTFTVE